MALGLILAGGFWIERSTRPAPASAPDTTVGKVVAPNGIAPSIKPAATAPKPGEFAATPGADAPVPANMSADAAVPANSGLPSVGDILAEPDEDYVRVAKKLSAVATDSRVPMAEREEALAHALNLSAGNEDKVLTPLIKNPDLPDDMAETILSEALNRPLDYQADLYLEALAARKTPELQAKIREHLAFLTGGEDKGANPEAWKPALQVAKASWAQ